MRVVSVLVGLALWQVGCGPGVSSPQSASTAPLVRVGLPPPSDEAGFRGLLGGEVMNGGLWFADSSCQSQFGQAGTITSDTFDAFAHCVAGLHLRPTGRADGFDDVSVLTDDAGFEIEAKIVAGRLEFIGFSARTPGAPDLPSITPQSLESLRVAGDPDATLGAGEASNVASSGAATRTQTEHLRICLSETGELSTVMPAATTTLASAAAFSAVARGWKFRPFVVAGKPIAACAIVGFQYPAGPRDPDRDRLPRPPELSKAGNRFYIVNTRDLEALRVGGSKAVVPDADDMTRLNGRRVVGTFKLCLDETGHYEQGVLLRSTGISEYDAKIARTMMEWVYRPYVVDGVAIPVCTAVTFIYTQH
jgi:hypothetical protein